MRLPVLSPSLVLSLTRRSLRRHVLSGSYNNYFHIYDREAATDTVLQADKSAFKAKKIGGNKGAKAVPTKGAKGAAGKSVDVESIDFNKKILHGQSLSLSSSLWSLRWTDSYPL